MTRRYHFGLVGHNISYTLSPKIFEALIKLQGAECDFEVFDISPEQFDSHLERLRTWDGFSVTIPYKQKFVPHMYQISKEALEIGAINSVRVDAGRFCGYNTDAEAFMATLGQMSLESDRILLLGHGGAARAVLWGLANQGADLEIYFCGRNKEKVARFVETCNRAYGGKHSIYPTLFGDIGVDDKYDLIVNCTPVGGMTCPEMSPIPEGFRFNDCRLYYDLNYFPARTTAMNLAAQSGCRIIGGLPMLVRQAIVSYTIWTGCKIDFDIVSLKILELLGEDNQGVIS